MRVESRKIRFGQEFSKGNSLAQKIHKGYGALKELRARMENNSESISKDVTLINQIEAVPTILDVIRSTTGMGFVAVARHE